MCHSDSRRNVCPSIFHKPLRSLNKCQLQQTDPRDVLRPPFVLYTKVDA